MIVEYGPTNDRWLDRRYSSAVLFIQRAFISTAVRLDALRSFVKQRRPEQSLLDRLADLGIDPERIHWSPLTIKPWKLAFLIELIEKKPPKCVLEVGSGVTTLVLAALAERHGFKMLSLENYHGSVGYLHHLSAGMKCAQHIRLQQCQLTVKKPERGGRRYVWFNADLEAWRGLFDFVIIDAPMAQLVGRRGALPEIEPYLSPDHRIVLDDSTRRHERACVAEWLKRFPNLNVRHYKKYPDVAVLRLNKTVRRAQPKAA